jgi:vacuolar-type H+-ATPase subunit E/Vma4
MDETVVSDAVKALLERMDHVPEDFIEGPWRGLINALVQNLETHPREMHISEYGFLLTKAEKQALLEKYRLLRREMFFKEVVEKLINPPKQREFDFQRQIKAECEKLEYEKQRAYLVALEAATRQSGQLGLCNSATTIQQIGLFGYQGYQVTSGQNPYTEPKCKL